MPPAKLLFLGDSITEWGVLDPGEAVPALAGQPGWLAHVQCAYRRRADVVCRGFSGYNSRWLRAKLSEILSGSDATPSSCSDPTAPTSATAGTPPPAFDVATVFVGTNDNASNPWGGVPVAEF